MLQKVDYGKHRFIWLAPFYYTFTQPVSFADLFALDSLDLLFRRRFSGVAAWHKAGHCWPEEADLFVWIPLEIRGRPSPNCQ